MKKETYKLVYDYFNQNADNNYTAKIKTRLWFRVDNPVLGHKSPLDIIKLGGEDFLIDLIKHDSQYS